MSKKLRLDEFVPELPVVRFYYQGHHSHPVRRTVLVIREDSEIISGYEIREGKTVRHGRSLLKTVKTYNKDEIANYGDYSRLRQSRKSMFKRRNESTLERVSLVSMFAEGI